MGRVWLFRCDADESEWEHELQSARPIVPDIRLLRIALPIRRPKDIYDRRSVDALLKQIALGEDSALELKALEFSGNKVTAPHKDSMADELAAMANTVAGIVLLGVDDKSRSVQGIPLDKLDIVEGWLRAICNDSIDPP